MFKKLLTNLPYNPSLIGQVSFYAKRLHAEERIRKLGFVFVVLAFLVQMFAFISQPEPSLASSSNDIINGGFTTRSEAASKCRSNAQSFASVLSYYGVDCDRVANASTITIRSNAADYDSLGRNQQGPTIYRPITGKTNPTDEYPVDIPGVGRFWMKNLRAWDSYSHSDYKVLKMTNKHGQTIFIMYSCGNIVTIGKYSPPAAPKPVNRRPAASFTANCTAIVWKASDPDGRPRVRLYIAKGTSNSDTDWSNKGPFVHSVSPTGSGTTNDGSWSIPSKYRTTTDRYRVFVVVSDKLPDGTMDDTNYVRATPASGVLFGPCVKETPPPEQPEPPELPCEESENEEDVQACLTLSKKARNNTQDIDNADGTMANGGDSITYTLSVKNTGKVKIDDFVVEENVSDILDYADITDLNGAKLEGTFLRWPATDLSAGETVNKKFTVKVKNPIPSTPISSSDPAHFDLIMNNVYGNQVTIKLPSDVVKTTEIVTQTLPNTGPGETMAAVVGFTVFVSYFFARTRLFAKEMDIVRTDYATSGGY
jgi:uncharacterized repeat protein (TIGR01451 family)